MADARDGGRDAAVAHDDVVAELAELFGQLTHRDTEFAVKTILDAMSDALARGQKLLERVGIAGAYEGALKYVGNPNLISRSHFARYLVEAGACSDMKQVFQRYLVPGKPGYVPHRWAALGDSIARVLRASGAAVTTRSTSRTVPRGTPSGSRRTVTRQRT